MAQILVRNLDEDVVARLKEHAKQEGRSLQSEVRKILEEAANTPFTGPKMDMKTARALVDQFREMFKGRKFTDSVELIREDRDR